MPFQKGQITNPGGRPKLHVAGEGDVIKYQYSAVTIKGRIERFLKRNMSAMKLQTMFNQLTAGQKLEMLLQLVPYILPRVQADSLSPEEIETLYTKLEQTLKDAAKTKIS